MDSTGLFLTDRHSLGRAERYREEVRGATRIGAYHRAQKREPAFIELYLDRIVAGWPSVVFWSRMIRGVILAKTLFHEVGHHAHRAVMPDQGDAEMMANIWRDWLFRGYVRRRFRYLLPFKGMFRFLAKALLRLMSTIKESQG